MIENEILYHLKELGYTEYEAKIYLALLDRHPASAYTLSQTSGVPHSRVYDIARRLIRKGLAVTAEKNPERFSPIPPAELIAKLKRDSSQSIEEYIIHDLYLAEIQRIFGASIEEKFGSNLSKLRKKFSL